jgi:hypothetical protein
MAAGSVSSHRKTHRAARTTGWAHPIVTRIVNIYFAIVVGVVKAIIGVVLGGAVAVCARLPVNPA